MTRNCEYCNAIIFGQYCSDCGKNNEPAFSSKESIKKSVRSIFVWVYKFIYTIFIMFIKCPYYTKYWIDGKKMGELSPKGLFFGLYSLMILNRFVINIVHHYDSDPQPLSHDQVMIMIKSDAQLRFSILLLSRINKYLALLSIYNLKGVYNRCRDYELVAYYALPHIIAVFVFLCFFNKLRYRDCINTAYTTVSSVVIVWFVCSWLYYFFGMPIKYNAIFYILLAATYILNMSGQWYGSLGGFIIRIIPSMALILICVFTFRIAIYVISLIFGY